MDEKFKVELNRFLEVGRKKGNVNEEDIYFRLMKYDASRDDINEFVDEIEKNGIRVIRASEEDLSKESLDDIIVQVNVDDPVKMYLKDIGKVPLLSSDEEIDLAKRMAEGDQAAKAKLSESNLRLVVSIAKRYVSRSNLQCLDLIQEGNIGLLKAVETFYFTHDFRFSPYATLWIRQSFTCAIADQDRQIGVPVTMVKPMSLIPL